MLSLSDVAVLVSRRTEGSWSALSRLAKQLLGHQYAQEMWLLEGRRSTKWVARLPTVIAALNSEVTHLTSQKPRDAIKVTFVVQNPSSVVAGCPAGLSEQKLPSSAGIHYLHQPGELEGGRCRVTSLVWSLQVYRLGHSDTRWDKPVLYYLLDSQPCGWEELPVVPSCCQRELYYSNTILESCQ